ncbi:MAG: hypothetical protein OXI91_11535 [Chloroflexota bacterium]|nr:hypothetical protein [Chloroflexota bacterium]
MTTETPGIHRSESIEDLHHLRLMALLDELVRDKGPRQAAADLDVDHRTLTASLESGRLTRRMRVALDRALLDGAGSPGQEQRQRNDLLAKRLERVEELAGETAVGLAAAQGEVAAHGQALRSIEGRLAGVESAKGPSSATPAVSSSQPPSPPRPPRREFPELATLEPAADDEAVFNDAWPLIREWRVLRQRHPDRGQGLDWLRDEERLMTVELALLEDHGLTLPPQDYPLTGLNRNNQTNWRSTTLAETRRARRRRERLRWPLRALALALRQWRR